MIVFVYSFVRKRVISLTTTAVVVTAAITAARGSTSINLLPSSTSGGLPRSGRSGKRDPAVQVQFK